MSAHSIQNLLYSCVKFTVMNLTKDIRDIDVIYVDKINRHVANNDTIIKLVNDSSMNNVDVYVNIISAGYNLNKTEIEVLRYVVGNNNKVSITKVHNDVARIVGKSTMTINRAIHSLRVKKLVYINENDDVQVSSAVLTDVDTINKAQFIVIEVAPKVTSNGL